MEPVFSLLKWEIADKNEGKEASLNDPCGNGLDWRYQYKHNVGLICTHVTWRIIYRYVYVPGLHVCIYIHTG